MPCLNQTRRKIKLRSVCGTGMTHLPLSRQVSKQADTIFTFENDCAVKRTTKALGPLNLFAIYVLHWERRLPANASRWRVAVNSGAAAWPLLRPLLLCDIRTLCFFLRCVSRLPATSRMYGIQPLPSPRALQLATVAKGARDRAALRHARRRYRALPPSEGKWRVKR